MNAYIIAMIVSQEGYYNPSHFSDLIALSFLFFNHFPALHTRKI